MLPNDKSRSGQSRYSEGVGEFFELSPIQRPGQISQPTVLSTCDKKLDLARSRCLKKRLHVPKSHDGVVGAVNEKYQQTQLSHLTEIIKFVPKKQWDFDHRAIGAGESALQHQARRRLMQGEFDRPVRYPTSSRK